MNERLDPQFDELTIDSEIDFTELPDGGFVHTSVAQRIYFVYGEQYGEANQAFGGLPWKITKDVGLSVAAGLTLVGGGLGLAHLLSDGGVDTAYAQDHQSDFSLSNLNLPPNMADQLNLDMTVGQAIENSRLNIPRVDSLLGSEQNYLLSLSLIDTQSRSRVFGVNLCFGVSPNDSDVVIGCIDDFINGSYSRTIQMNGSFYPELAQNPSISTAVIDGIVNKTGTKTMFLGTEVAVDNISKIRGGEIIVDYDDPDLTRRIKVSSTGLPDQARTGIPQTRYGNDNSQDYIERRFDTLGTFRILADSRGIPIGNSWIKVDMQTATPTTTRTATSTPIVSIEPTRTLTSTATTITGGGVRAVSLKDDPIVFGFQSRPDAATNIIVRIRDNNPQVVAVLPVSMTTFRETDNTPGFSCYLDVFAGFRNEILGWSNLICAVLGSRSITGAPAGVSVSLEGNMTRFSFASTTEGRVLGVFGARQEFIPASSGANSISHDTLGNPTLYSLFAVNGTSATGNSNYFVTVPGVGR